MLVRALLPLLPLSPTMLVRALLPLLLLSPTARPGAVEQSVEDGPPEYRRDDSKYRESDSVESELELFGGKYPSSLVAGYSRNDKVEHPSIRQNLTRSKKFKKEENYKKEQIKLLTTEKTILRRESTDNLEYSDESLNSQENPSVNQDKSGLETTQRHFRRDPPKFELYEPDWLEADHLGDFGRKVSKTVQQFAELTRTDAFSRRQDDFDFFDTPFRPKKFQTFSDSAMTKSPKVFTDFLPDNYQGDYKQFEKLKVLEQTGPNQVSSPPSPPRHSSSTSTFRPNRDRVESEAVVIIDGIATKAEDVDVTFKPVFTVDSLLTPDFEGGQPFKLNQKITEENFRSVETPEKGSLSEKLVKGVQNGYNSILGNLRNLLGGGSNRRRHGGSNNSPLSPGGNLPHQPPLDLSRRYVKSPASTHRLEVGNEVVQLAPLASLPKPWINTDPKIAKPVNRSKLTHEKKHTERDRGTKQSLESDLIGTKQSDIALKEDFFSQEMEKLREIFPAQFSVNAKSATKRRADTASQADLKESRRRRVDWINNNKSNNDEIDRRLDRLNRKSDIAEEKLPNTNRKSESANWKWETPTGKLNSKTRTVDSSQRKTEKVSQKSGEIKHKSDNINRKSDNINRKSDYFSRNREDMYRKSADRMTQVQD